MDMVISVTKHLPGLSSCTLPGSLNVEAPRIFHFFLSGEDVAGGWRGCSRGLYPLPSDLVEPWSWGEEQTRSESGLS